MHVYFGAFCPLLSFSNSELIPKTVFLSLQNLKTLFNHSMSELMTTTKINVSKFDAASPSRANVNIEILNSEEAIELENEHKSLQSLSACL